MIIFIDFDGTVTPNHYPLPLINDPYPGCVAKIQSWVEQGHTVIISSCRGNPDICDDSSKQEMVAYLTKHNIPYHGVDDRKPFFHLLVDDRAADWTPDFWLK